MRESNTSRGAAFTLVELLVVIVVLALLLTITVPAIRRAMALAEGSKCKSNMLFMGRAHALYGSENRFNNPPIVWITSRSFGYFLTGPHVKMYDQPVGQGILVKGNYISLRTLLCPAATMFDDAAMDEEAWAKNSTSGSSYSYFWRHSSSFEKKGDLRSDYKYTDAEAEGRYGLSMDYNAQAGHGFIGAIGPGALVSHPQLGLVNIVYSDGSVRSEDNSKVVLSPPFNVKGELAWWELAHQAWE